MRRIGNGSPYVVGHRGFGRQAPENTLPSFRLALAAGADLVELDYHHSREGVPIVLHDSTLDRTTDATNRWGGSNLVVAARTVAEVQSLDAGRWFAPQFAGTSIPTLEEALRVIQAGGTTLIERKGGDPATLIHLLRERGWAESVVVQSFDWGFVKAAHALAPELVLGALGPPSSRNGRKLSEEERALSAEFVREVAALGARLVVWNRQVNAASLAEAAGLGLDVWVYTINDPAEAEALVRLGVKGIITDDPAAIRARLHPQADDSEPTASRRSVPATLEEHPGNIYLEGQPVRIRVPERLPTEVSRWRVLNDLGLEVGRGELAQPREAALESIVVPGLKVGWYRVEFGTEANPAQGWTTAAVLPQLVAPTPEDSPVCLDLATSWFARNDPTKQRQFANLAALAGVNWVRDRLRWSELEPEPGALVARTTTYDTAADAQHAAGLKVLQVFHDTPVWARESPEAGGRFAPDLRLVYAFGRALAERFRGRVLAWEPWNEGNIAGFGGHTVDQMCAWQKAAWLGFKSADPSLIVGWNVTAAVPTPQHSEGVLANGTWPYFDTYNIHSYDWPDGYADLWTPAREAAAGRSLWITEADRGTKHLGNDPWFDQDPRLERLKAEWIAQSYASSLFAGARRHFHFILGHYHEPNGVQFGLLRLDLTPRPAYVALAAVGRCLAGARALGRWHPTPDVHVYAFRGRPDGQQQDVLVVWAEKQADWDGRGQAQAGWRLPSHLMVQGVVDYLGRPVQRGVPFPLTSAPVFVFLPPGQAATLPLESPPRVAAAPTSRPAVPVVLQLALPRAAEVRVEDRPWSEGYAYVVATGQPHPLPLRVYSFTSAPARVGLALVSKPADWQLALPEGAVEIGPQDRAELAGQITIPASTSVTDGWVVIEADAGPMGRSPLAFRIQARPRIGGS